MARRMQTHRLDLWMNGLPVGYWESGHQGERLAYRNDWIEHPQGRPLSLSLPFTPDNQVYGGHVIADYFDNLLPDSEPIRRRIALRHRTGGTAPFALLARLGRDCVGPTCVRPWKTSGFARRSSPRTACPSPNVRSASSRTAKRSSNVSIADGRATQKARLAMAVRGKNLHYLIEQIQHRHWLAQGQRAGFSAMEVEEMINDLTARTAGVIDLVSTRLPENFPGDIAEAIFSGMRRLNGKLERASPT